MGGKKRHFILQSDGVSKRQLTCIDRQTNPEIEGNSPGLEFSNFENIRANRRRGAADREVSVLVDGPRWIVAQKIERRLFFSVSEE